MGEERVNNADSFALSRHDVDRICRSASRSRGRLGHENTRLRLLPHEHRERTDVVEMGMRKEQRVHRQAGESAEERQSHFPFLLRMHPAIEHHALTPGAEIIAVGADFGSACQIDELQG